MGVIYKERKSVYREQGCRGFNSSIGHINSPHHLTVSACLDLTDYGILTNISLLDLQIVINGAIDNVYFLCYDILGTIADNPLAH
jgi:hypothetical protein